MAAVGGSDVPAVWVRHTPMARAEQGAERGVVALGQLAGRAVVGRPGHDDDAGSPHVPRRDAAGQALDQQASGGHLVVAYVVVAAATEGQVVEVDGLDPLRLRLDLDLGADARVDRIEHQDPGAAGDVVLGLGELRGVAAAGVLHYEL